MEGAATMVSRKGRPDAYLDRTPYMITCNTWPWCRFLQSEHVTAFRNRCSIYKVQTAPWMADYAEEGDLDPRAWLCLVARATTSTPANSDNEDDMETEEEEQQESNKLAEDQQETEKAQKQPVNRKLIFDSPTSSVEVIPPTPKEKTNQAIQMQRKILEQNGGALPIPLSDSDSDLDCDCDETDKEDSLANISDAENLFGHYDVDYRPPSRCSCGCEDDIDTEAEAEARAEMAVEWMREQLTDIAQNNILSHQGFIISQHDWRKFQDMANRELIFLDIQTPPEGETYNDMVANVAKELFDIEYCNNHNVQMDYKVSNTGYLAAVTAGYKVSSIDKMEPKQE